MTKANLIIVRKALKILENEFYQTESVVGYKQFLFMGEKKQAKAFYLKVKKSDIEAVLEQDGTYENVWSVRTEEVDEVQHDVLGQLRSRILETVK